MNITASLGPDGVLLVNTRFGADDGQDAGGRQTTGQPPASAARRRTSVSARTVPGSWGWASPYINAIISSPAPPRPLRYIINTSAAPEHIGGNEKIATSGFFPRGRRLRRGRRQRRARTHRVVAHENVLNRDERAVRQASRGAGSVRSRPTRISTSSTSSRILQRRSGNRLSRAGGQYRWRQPRVFPSLRSDQRRRHVFDGQLSDRSTCQKGGSIQGVINGLNHILDLAVAEYRGQGGTWIIPSHGRLSDTADVASYRNMLTMIRDRVQGSDQQGHDARASESRAAYDGL